MSQAQIKELEDLLLRMDENNAPSEDIRFIVSELNALTSLETPETPAARKPRGRGEIAQAKKQEEKEKVIPAASDGCDNRGGRSPALGPSFVPTRGFPIFWERVDWKLF